jgi:hypothetical protein
MKFNLKKRPQSVLGLSLSDGQLRAALVARVKGQWEVVKTASTALSLDLLHPEPDLIGREIKNHLDAAGIHERNCVIAVPPSWVMSQQTLVPDLPPEDVASFLQIEAEKGFPCDTAQLQIARSDFRSSTAAYATQLAVRKEHLDRLAAVAKAAGLKPASFALGLATLPGVIAPADDGRITIAVEPHGAVIVVSTGGGIAAFRTSDGAIESEAGEKVVNGGALARELRITFEQVPADLRRGLRHLRLCGDEALVRQLAERLGDWAASAGLTIDSPGSAEDRLGAEIAEGVARQWLEPSGPPIEFLPPRPGRWEAMMVRYSSKRLATAGIAVGAVAAVTLVVFGWQEFQVLELRSEWSTMQARVTALKAVQDRIRVYRPWYDHTVPDLRIWQRVTECFPENGSLTAKSFDIHKVAGVTTVSISGTARDGQALLKAQEKLRKARDIQSLNVEAISGKMPAQFTLTFRWIGSSGS